MGNFRNYRTRCPIRKPIARAGYEIPSKRDYKRDKHEDYEIIKEGLKEFEEEKNED